MCDGDAVAQAVGEGVQDLLPLPVTVPVPEQDGDTVREPVGVMVRSAVLLPDAVAVPLAVILAVVGDGDEERLGEAVSEGLKEPLRVAVKDAEGVAVGDTEPVRDVPEREPCVSEHVRECVSLTVSLLWDPDGDTVGVPLAVRVRGMDPETLSERLPDNVMDGDPDLLPDSVRECVPESSERVAEDSVAERDTEGERVSELDRVTEVAVALRESVVESEAVATTAADGEKVRVGLWVTVLREVVGVALWEWVWEELRVSGGVLEKVGEGERRRVPVADRVTDCVGDRLAVAVPDEEADRELVRL